MSISHMKLIQWLVFQNGKGFKQQNILTSYRGKFNVTNNHRGGIKWVF